jgi:hypothetical protein
MVGSREAGGMEDTQNKHVENSDEHPAIGRSAQPGHQETTRTVEESFSDVPRGALSAIRASLRQAEAQLDQLESQLQAAAASARPGREQPPTSLTWFSALLALTTLLIIGVRLFKLATLQTDIYGDIEIVHQFASGVRSGNWPFEYVLGVGPLYHYLIQPVILLTGLNYYGLKISAVITSLGALLATYALARRLVNEHFALLAAAIAGVSSWLLVFSRLGISLILSPLLVTCALWLIIRILQERRSSDVVACAIVSAMGIYAYPQLFVLPIIAFLTLLCLRWIGHPISWSDLRRFAIVSILSTLPFAWMFLRSPEGFIHGYIGSKFFTESNPFGALMRNFVSAVLAYHVKGDSIFRNNPSYLPHLDPLSGLLFLAGIVFWLRPEQRRWSPLLFVPFVLLHVPSALVLDRPTEVPNAGRTLGVAPIAYILVASGVWWLVQFLAGAGRRRAGIVIAGLLFGTILLLNMQRYFGIYSQGLPYHDISIGGEIASYAGTLPPETQVYVVGCCWEGGMPEVPFVQLVAARPENMHELNPADLTCGQLGSLPQPAVLIWSFHDLLPAEQVAACQQWLPAQLYMSPKGWPVFYSAPLLREGD